MIIEIRKAQESDYKICGTIGLDNYKSFIKKRGNWLASYAFKRYFSEERFIRRSKNQYDIYIACYQNKIVGFMELEKKEILASCYVKKDYHYLGIGTLLLKKAELLCLKGNKSSTYLSLEASDYAIDFYKKKGYQTSKERKRLLGIDMTPMRKKIKELT
jgi:Acetyltransferases